MRDIRFRAWDKKNRFEMAYILVIDFNERYVVVDAEWNKDIETGESECVANFDEIEIMQYTGLKDKNGKEIYEGDIVKEMDSKNYPIGDINWSIGRWRCGDTYIRDFDWRKLEVIGNTYENPELLEDKP